jgi:hypothetical protein
MKEDNGTFGIIVGGLVALVANWAARRPSWAMKTCPRSRQPISK